MPGLLRSHGAEDGAMVRLRLPGGRIATSTLRRLAELATAYAVIAQRLRAAARSDLVIAIYNPASRSRTAQVELARALLLTHRSPRTPVIIGARGTTVLNGRVWTSRSVGR